MAEETQEIANGVIRYIVENAEEALLAAFAANKIHLEDLKDALLNFASMNQSEQLQWITM